MIREGKETYPNKAAQVKHERAEPAKVERREERGSKRPQSGWKNPPAKTVKTGY